MINKTVAHYEILEQIGFGGMGQVYRARDTRLGRDVAIKFLAPEAANDPVGLQRFMSEARLASALNHPNIITLYEIGECEEGHYLVTELIEGRTLKEIMAEGELSAAEGTNILLQAAEGLAKAHQAGIVHRDIKPSNLMVTHDGLVKILDFGLAKLHGETDLAEQEQSPDLTKTGTVVGTMAYLAPERLYGAAADARSDVFSLAVVGYELLYGRHPFLRDSVSGTLKSILQEDPASGGGRNDAVPEELDAVLREGMSKEPADRFPTARELAEALRVWATVLPHGRSSARHPGPGARRRAPWVGAALFAVLVAAFAWMQRDQTTTAPTEVPTGGDLAVAVLPAADQTGEPELARAGIGRILGDIFVNVLSDVEEVYVVSPVFLEGVARELGRPLDDASRDADFARQVCRSADATAMLRSNLSKVGEAYVLTASLTGMERQQLLGTFSASSADPVQLLSDMSEGMRSAIQERFRPRAPMAGGGGHLATSSMEAYAHYVRGRDHIGLAQWEEARQELEAALAIDPEMGVAWSELACAYSFMEVDEPLVEKAQTEAERWMRGLSRKDQLWIQLNSTWLRTANGPAYLDQLGTYLEEYPDDRNAYFYGGLASQWLNGNCREALDWFEKAYELTPFYHPITKGLVDCRMDLGERAAAILALERYLSLPRAPGHGRAWAEHRLAEIRGE